MLRREARLRKEYLYRKALEASEKRTDGQKDILRTCLEQNVPIPAGIRHEAVGLTAALGFEEDRAGVRHMDYLLSI